MPARPLSGSWQRNLPTRPKPGRPRASMPKRRASGATWVTEYGPLERGAMRDTTRRQPSCGPTSEIMCKRHGHGRQPASTPRPPRSGNWLGVMHGLPSPGKRRAIIPELQLSGPVSASIYPLRQRGRRVGSPEERPRITRKPTTTRGQGHSGQASASTSQPRMPSSGRGTSPVPLHSGRKPARSS